MSKHKKGREHHGSGHKDAGEGEKRKKMSHMADLSVLRLLSN